jgi:alkylhydroperoxidase family enzyme
LSVVTASHAPYPLGWHILDAEEAGLRELEIKAIIGGQEDATLEPGEAAVVRFARELAVDAALTDATFKLVAEFMDDRQLVDLITLVGLYRLVACIANGLQVELDGKATQALERVRGGADRGAF